MMKKLSIFCLSLGIAIASYEIAFAIPLKAVSEDRVRNIGLDWQLQPQSMRDGNAVYCREKKSNCPLETSPQVGWNESSRQSLLTAVDRSLNYLNSPKAKRDYAKYRQSPFNLSHIRRSLLRFKVLLLATDSPQQLEKAVKKEFAFYQSSGQDNRGKVEFTGYFEPSYSASAVPTAEYRYPLYRQPANFARWSRPHPTRAQLEGKDGLSAHKGRLAGYELVWLRDRLEAFLVQVQGSAKLQLTDGTTMSVGYGGATNYQYSSIGKELVKDGIFTIEELSLPKLLAYFDANPQQLDEYIPRNNRFIFFKQTNGAPPIGSLGVPVTGDRSIATDKSLMPPGALALIVAPIPDVNDRGEIETRVVSRYVLDQDTGSAIKGAGRVDIFMGSGKLAGEKAGRVNDRGSLFYLLLKE